MLLLPRHQVNTVLYKVNSLGKFQGLPPGANRELERMIRGDLNEPSKGDQASCFASRFLRLPSTILAWLASTAHRYASDAGVL